MRTRKYFIGMVAAAIITAAIFAAVVNILDLQQEANVESVGNAGAEPGDDGSGAAGADPWANGRAPDKVGR